MLTDGRQIAAARQLLGWSQMDLAEKAGVSKPSIVRAEKDLMSVKEGIRQAIREAFDTNNVEFIEGGVRQSKNIVDVYEGDDCYMRLMDDAYNELSKSKGEILFSASNERRSPQIIVDKFNAMRTVGITMRSLIQYDDTYMMGSLDEYRWMDQSLFVDSDVKVIFSDKTAYFMSWDGTPRVIVIQDQYIAEESRRLFEFIWSVSEMPTHSTAKVKYND